MIEQLHPSIALAVAQLSNKGGVSAFSCGQVVAQTARNVGKISVHVITNFKGAAMENDSGMADYRRAVIPDLSR